MAGSALVARGIGALGADAHAGFAILPIIGAAAGLLILAGLWTPVAGVAAGIVEVWLAFTGTGNHVAIIFAALAISLAMIGPGAWSVDARLYGRKQILPPEL